MHAVWLARELEIGEVIVPWSPGTFSAWGMLQSDIRRDLTVSFYQPVASIQPMRVEEEIGRLQSEGLTLIQEQRIAEEDIYYAASADMRYIGQEYFVNIPISVPADLAVIEADFHAAHASRYGHSTPGAPVEFVNLRLAALGRLKSEVLGFRPSESQGDPVRESRKVTFDGQALDTNVLTRELMPIDTVYDGPIVVEEDSSTTVIPPEFSARIDRLGNLVITRKD